MRNHAAADFFVLADLEGAAVKAYGVDDLLDDGLAAPSAFIIDSDGVIRWTYVADDIADRPTASQLLAALAEISPAPRYSLFENQESGVSFMYPTSWTSIPVEDPEEGPWAVLETDHGITLKLLAEFHAPGVDLRYPLVTTMESLFVEGVTPTLLGLRHFTLEGGYPALRADLLLQTEDAETAATIQAAERGGGVFTVVASGPTGLLREQQEDVNRVFNSFEVSVPSPYGIDRSTAFTMPLGRPSTLDPHMSGDVISHFYVSNIFSGLAKLGEGLAVVPELAESWEVDENGTVYTFTLREGITFHDGRPITAADFKYSIERATEHELHSDTALLYLTDIVGARAKLEDEADEVSGVVVVDDRTLRITIDSPKEYFLAKLTYPTSYVVDSASIEGQGEEWWRAGSLNGSGPYTLHTWDTEEVLILKRFDNYYNPPPMQHIISPFDALPGANGRQMYESGYWDGIYIRLSSVDRLRADEALGSHVREFDQLDSYFVGIDSDKAPLDDPRVRRAFAMAVDRQELVDELFNGNVQLANGLLPPGLPGFSEDLQGIPFDPAGAIKLLAESGYGENLPEVTLLAARNSRGEPSSIVQFLIDSWKQNLGITVSLNLVEPEEYYNIREELEGHFFTSGWIADYPDPENFLDLLLHSESHDSRYANPVFDNLLELARLTQDREARLNLYMQAEQLLLDDAGIIPLFHTHEYALIQPYVRNFTIGAVGQPNIADVTYEDSP